MHTVTLNNKKDKFERNHLLDILKAVAIIFVIFGHGIDCSNADAVRKQIGVVYWIDQAVPMFLIITGFLFATSYDHKQIKNFTDVYEPKPLITRLLRFFIPYLILFIAEETAWMCVKLHGWDPDFFRIFFAGGRGPGAYYAPLLIQFVLVFPAIYFIMNRFKFKGLMGMLITNIVYEIFQYSINMPSNVYKYLIFRYLFLLSAGVYINISIKEKIKCKWVFAAISFAIGLTLITCATYVKMPTFPQFAWHSTSVFGALYIVPIMSLLIKFVKVKRVKIFNPIGKSTYNAYLAQKTYFCFKRPWFIVTENMWGQIFFNIPVCLMVGWLFWFAEHYLTNFITKKINEFTPKKHKKLGNKKQNSEKEKKHEKK